MVCLLMSSNALHETNQFPHATRAIPFLAIRPYLENPFRYFKNSESVESTSELFFSSAVL